MFTSVNINYVRWQLRLENQLKCQLRWDTKYLTILYLGNGQLWCACRLQREACILPVVNWRPDIALYDYRFPSNRVSNCDMSRRWCALFAMRKAFRGRTPGQLDLWPAERELSIRFRSIIFHDQILLLFAVPSVQMYQKCQSHNIPCYEKIMGKLIFLSLSFLFSLSILRFEKIICILISKHVVFSWIFFCIKIFLMSSSWYSSPKHQENSFNSFKNTRITRAEELQNRL